MRLMHERFEVPADCRFIRLGIDPVLEGLEIAARHEVIAGAADDQHSDRFVVVGLRRDLTERSDHRLIERVEHRRSIEGQGANTVGGFDEHGVIG